MLLLIKPAGATAGPQKSKDLINNHRDAIEEVQNALRNLPAQNDEEVEFLIIRDSELVLVNVLGRESGPIN